MASASELESARRRVMAVVESSLATNRELLPRSIHRAVAAIVVDAMATHPLFRRLLRAALDPDAPVRALRAAFEGPAPAEPFEATSPDWLLSQRDLTAAQLDLLTTAPELILPIAAHIVLRTGESLKSERLFEPGRQALLEAARVFVPGGDIPFECLAWCHVHAAMSGVVDEVLGGEPSSDRLVAPALRAARRAAYDILSWGEHLDGDGRPEPIDDAPLMQLESYLDEVLISTVLAVEGVVARDGVEPDPGPKRH